MTPEEIAMKFSLAGNTCQGGLRCPYASECTGKKEDCRLNEVAMVIRAELAKNDRLTAKVEALTQYVKDILGYADALEKVCRRYESLVTKFCNGYRPPRKPGKKKPIYKKIERRKQLDLIEYDGKPEYGLPPRPREPKLPMVVI